MHRPNGLSAAIGFDQNVGNLTYFAVFLFPVANGILFVQKCESYGLGLLGLVGLRLWLGLRIVGIRRSGVWTDRPVAAVRPTHSLLTPFTFRYRTVTRHNKFHGKM